MEQSQQWLVIGAASAALTVLLGAFGAHGLENRLNPADLSTYETAVRYQMYHSLALIMLSTVSRSFDGTLISAAGYLFIVGIILFSGSLYVLVLTDTRWLGAITPFGGAAFAVAWFLTAYAGWKG